MGLSSLEVPNYDVDNDPEYEEFKKRVEEEFLQHKNKAVKMKNRKF
jgi:hypothetical protein